MHCGFIQTLLYRPSAILDDKSAANMKQIVKISAMLFVGIFIAANCHAQSFLTNGLVAYYPFNGNANDESENGNNGEVHNATLTSDRFGNPSSAFYFNGSSSYISIPSSQTLMLTENMTFSFWMKRMSVGGMLLCKGDGEGAYGVCFLKHKCFNFGYMKKPCGEKFKLALPFWTKCANTTARWNRLLLLSVFEYRQSMPLA